MADNLNALLRPIYAALDIVSREPMGFTNSVAMNTAPTEAAKGQIITIPVTQSAETHDIKPGLMPENNGEPDIETVNMTITKSKYAAVKWDGEEQLGVRNSGDYEEILADQFAQAMRALANEVEADLAALYIGASRAYGTPGTTPFETSIKDVAFMRKILLENGAPMSNLRLVIGTAEGANLRSLGQLTKANEAATDETLRRGVLLNVSGFDIRESGQIALHEAGKAAGALVNNADGYSQGDTIIAVDGASSIGLNAGDVLSFAGNPGKYLLAKDATATPLTIAAPGLMGDVADDAAVTVGGSYTANLAFDKNAIQLIARAPKMPEGGDMATDVTVVVDPVSKLPFQIAMYKIYRQVKYEVGLAWGVKLIKPEHVAVLLG